jgi:hypothetical protein
VGCVGCVAPSDGDCEVLVYPVGCLLVSVEVCVCVMMCVMMICMWVIIMMYVGDNDAPFWLCCVAGAVFGSSVLLPWR